LADTLTSAALDREAIAALSSGGPAWLRELRAGAYDRFDKLPTPNERSEGWRRLSLKGIDLTPPRPKPSTFSITISDADRRKGVAALPLSEALGAHETIVREALVQARGGRTVGKYSALAEAAWQTGSFIYVPDGVETSEPIVVQSGEGPYPRVVIALGKHARAAITETHNERDALVAGITDIALGEGAHLTYAHVQDAAPQTVIFSHQHARVGRDAKLVTFNLGSGGKLAKSDIEVELLGKGAESDMLGLVFGHGEQQFDYHTLQGHRSSDTHSDLLFKSALDGHAHSVYTGVIIIEKGAQRSDAYQANRNLLLDEGARADTEPKLEIEADDVRCTHGATVGPIDAEQLFYLGSRGLDRTRASRLIVEGFFQDVFDRVGDARVTGPLAAKFAPDLGTEA
jgi:Fe-S cluster assembly protein SufD